MTGSFVWAGIAKMSAAIYYFRIKMPGVGVKGGDFSMGRRVKSGEIKLRLNFVSGYIFHDGE